MTNTLEIILNNRLQELLDESNAILKSLKHEQISAVVFKQKSKRLSKNDWVTTELIGILKQHYEQNNTKFVIPRTVDIEDIQEIVSRSLKIPVSVICGESRDINIVRARHIAIYLIFKDFEDVGLKAIGMAMGGKHHSTIIHAKNKVQQSLDNQLNNKQLHTEYYLCFTALQKLKHNQ